MRRALCILVVILAAAGAVGAVPTPQSVLDHLKLGGE